MWDLAVREDDYQGAEGMVQRMARPPLSMRVLLTFASGDTAKRASIVEEARTFDSYQSQIGGRYVATFLEDFAAAQSQKSATGTPLVGTRWRATELGEKPVPPQSEATEAHLVFERAGRVGGRTAVTE